MARLGQIDAVKREGSEEPDTFELLGEDLELRCKPSGLDALEWTALIGEQENAQTDKERGQIGLRMAQTAQTLLKRSLTAPAYERFDELCRENQLGLDVVLQTVNLLMGAAAGRPTMKPSDSSDGQSSTSTSSSSEPVGLLDYTEIVGQPLVPVEHWAEKYLPKTA